TSTSDARIAATEVATAASGAATVNAMATTDNALATSEVAANQTVVAERAEVEGEQEATAQAATSDAQQATAVVQATTLALEAVENTPEATIPNQPTATPDPAQLAVEAQLNAIIREEDNMPMLFITGGTFEMGWAEGSSEDDNYPLHQVSVQSFRLDQYEVTVQQFADFLNQQGGNSGACDGVDCAKTFVSTTFTNLLNNLGVYEAQPGTSRQPATWVTWPGAVAYCAAVDARLPTEAEWEYAARGVDGRIYPWGNTQPSLYYTAVFGIISGQSAAFEDVFVRVDSLSDGASPFGIYGMAGGVAEWVQDWYDPDFYSQPLPAIGYNDEDSGEKVLRGGSWVNAFEDIRTFSRMALSPTNSNLNNLNNSHWGAGFRCAREVDQ
ncbi:MAG: SUMF1/EgtB/PvdO family nonheme iron enzyme, partial [Chloroflexi bacterium]|nr:SUMF1/EgtB/PvdO family nonheme iron enzyme [Chloroflexota bacterium]